MRCCSKSSQIQPYAHQIEAIHHFSSQRLLGVLHNNFSLKQHLTWVSCRYLFLFLGIYVTFFFGLNQICTRISLTPPTLNCKRKTTRFPLTRCKSISKRLGGIHLFDHQLVQSSKISLISSYAEVTISTAIWSLSRWSSKRSQSSRAISKRVF